LAGYAKVLPGIEIVEADDGLVQFQKGFQQI